MLDILRLLEQDCTLTPVQISAMTGHDISEVERVITDCQEKGIILGYKAKIDWDKTRQETVTAIIDVSVTPQRGSGFDRVAERIYQYDEVESLYLVSGGHDFSIVINGRTIKEVALFVAEKLSQLENVTSTATHFMLRRYKENGVIFAHPTDEQERMSLL
ncbi:MAG: Lrp/AsnC family transcriptional regulator [Oscillospiraceae bacterium]|nr:Lrp/AsnC family transcriptional regulator [Oscillospiraceae bacterium]